MSFNPHPVQRPGATLHIFALTASKIVSILTRCKDRVQPRAARTGTAYNLVSILTRCKDRVQHGPCISPRPAGCFNPHPVQRPGATDGITVSGPHADVSILTRCKDRVQREYTGSDYATIYVSILTRCKDRVQHNSTAGDNRTRPVSILTRCKDRVQRLKFSN